MRSFRFIVIQALLSLIWFPSQAQSSEGAFSLGTGFVVAEDHIVTAAHVIRGRDSVWVGPIGPKRWVKAQVVKVNEQHDLALISAKVEASVVKFARWSDVPTGLEIFVIGFPQPRLQGLSKKITQGIINGNRSDRNESFDLGYFQFSAEAQQGNSGGPIFSPDGLVVGMVQKKLNALSVAEKTNDLPVNVNYGLKSSEIIDFLAGTPAEISPNTLSLKTVLRPYQIFAQNQSAVFAVVGRKTPVESETPKP